MNYKQFLLSQLLRDFDSDSEDYNTLAYDTLWDLSFEILKEYEKQENLDIDMYTDIENFIKNNKEYLINLYEGNI